jgi:ribosomal protein L37E
MRDDDFCFLCQNGFGRWVIINASDPGFAWSGSRWIPQVHGMPSGGVQISNFDTKEDAFLGAEEAGLEIALVGYNASEESITCFTCGMTSYNPNDVREKYCGNCHFFHEPMSGS